MANYRPEMTDEGIHRLHEATVLDEHGEEREISLTGERPLTIYLDKREIVTLMTLGSNPELLTLGYLRNQHLVDNIEDIIAVQVDWDVEAVVVKTKQNKPNIDQLLSKKTVTSGCGQGTMFGHVMDSLDQLSLECPSFSADSIYHVLDALAEHNKMYKKSRCCSWLCFMCSRSDRYIC